MSMNCLTLCHKSDQHQFSPYYTNTSMIMIQMLWTFIKFSPLMHSLFFTLHLQGLQPMPCKIVWQLPSNTPESSPRALTTARLKSGDFEDPSNNRPISLLPILSKVSEHLAHRQLVDYLSTEKLVTTQSGNRSFHSTDYPPCLTDDFLLAMDSKRVSVVVPLDMSKACDSVSLNIQFYPVC